MVRLTKIYTRSGDAGQTGLGTGERVPKTHVRVEAYGEVDEANASIGLAIVAAAGGDATATEIAAFLRGVQNDLFDVGADLCVPVTEGEEAGSKLRITERHVARLEHEIDRVNARLSELRSFVLPGGSPLAAALHNARAIVRRAERCVVRLAEAEPQATNPDTVKYLNRLSDLLFVQSRAANNWGEDDVLWSPGRGGG